MSDSIENKLRNLSKSVEKPMPTLFYTAEPMEEGAGGGKGPGGPNPNTGKDCLVGIAPSWIFMIYDMLIYTMYGKSPGEPINGSIEGPGQVTTRDEPLAWQRVHPDFDPADPSTWGSVFGPGGEAERLINYFHCRTDSGQGESLCTPAEVSAFIDMLRQLYTRRCGFAVAESGACCFPAGDFSGFSCVQTNSEADCAARSGTFYSGLTCQQIGGDNCGLAPLPPEGPLPPVALNPQKAKSQTLAAKEIAAAVIRKLRGKSATRPGLMTPTRDDEPNIPPQVLGSCCSPVGDFGAFSCVQITEGECKAKPGSRWERGKRCLKECSRPYHKYDNPYVDGVTSAVIRKLKGK
jgi:hypothetical protein